MRHKASISSGLLFKRCLMSAVMSFYFFHCLPVFADDARVIGPVYPITETDFIQMAQKKIQEKMSGEDGKSWQDQQRLIRVAADRPSPVLGLRPTIHSRRWLFDPSFVIPSNVLSANGAILLKSGSRFNPLQKMHWDKSLLFIDGDDPAQVSWVKEQDKQLKGQDLLILVNGSLHAVAQQFPHKHIYFDQGGRLIQRLQITQVPAVVSQVGDQLEISEVKP
jgi:conjugal transfer pilus assembly protein TraW